MKSKLTRTLSVIIILLLITALSSCNKTTNAIEGHSHVIVVDKAVEATCTGTGLTEGSHCSECNAVLVEQRIVPARGHSTVVDKAVEATCTETGLTEGSHCSECNAVLVEQRIIPANGHSLEYTLNVDSHIAHCLKCDYELIEKHNIDPTTNKCQNCDFEIITPPPFHTGYITSEYTTIETEHFICKIDADSYVIDNLEYCLETLYDSLQIVSGLSFDTDKYGKISIEAKKAEPIDGYESELHTAYALHNGIVIGAGDLFVSGGYAIAHELSHVLHNHNSGWYYSKTFQEGFAVYSTYKVTRYMEENYPDIAYMIQAAEKNMHNTTFRAEGYEKLYSKPLSYWYENGFPYATNSDYAVGFRLMRYLDEVYGEYSSWITEYEKVNPYTLTATNRLAISEVVRVLPMTYGEDVENNFYAWLKQNEAFFEVNYDNATDRTQLSYTNIYPMYWRWLEKLSFEGLKYQDIYLNIDELRKYITEYKGDKLGNFRFAFNTLEPSIVKFYDSYGNLLAKHISEKTSNTYSLDGVGFIQFVGRGTIMKFYILGFASIE